MEGDALAAMLPLWSYKSELLTPKPEAYHPFLQKVTILAKAINRIKPFCLAWGSPLKPILWRTALQADGFSLGYIRGRCPRLLRVVPSRHRSACRV